MCPLHRWLACLLLLAATSVATAQSRRSVPNPEPVVTAAEQAIERGDNRTAESLISRIPAGSLHDPQLARVQILRAEIGLQRKSPQVVIRALPPDSSHVPLFAPRMEQLRARAQFALGDPVAAVRSLVMRERYLSTAGAIAENHELIWNGLVVTPIPRSAVTLIPAQDPMTRGWLDLGVVLLQGPTDAALGAWSQRHPAHPGSAKLPLIRTRTIQVAATVPAKPPQAAPAIAPVVAAPTMTTRAISTGGYALLLPIGGPLGSGGRALREGFISAWFELPEPRPTLRVYDTGSEVSGAVVALDAARREGAEFFVGPLTREAVYALARQPRGDRPWLTLNYLEAPVEGTLQFGLAPEDEARAAAQDAATAGRRRALVLAPENDWGTRVQAAYERGMTANGGEILQTLRYKPGTQDFSDPLKDLMNLDQSNQRHRAINAALGGDSEFEPRPRGDAEVLFAPARNAEMQLLLPQLEFFRARRLPTYAIASAYAGGTRNTDQLEGLRVCDMPWMIAASGSWADARTKAQDQFPEAMRDQPRLFALGADALRLAQAMQRGELDGARPIDGATGRLRLEAGGRIARDLSCASFRDGRLYP
ncbi:MAG: penicillin-binding protein activator [Panacagrimonas sp.]